MIPRPPFSGKARIHRFAPRTNVIFSYTGFHNLWLFHQPLLASIRHLVFHRSWQVSKHSLLQVTILSINNLQLYNLLYLYLMNITSTKLHVFLFKTNNYISKRKVGERSLRWHQDSLFNCYYTELLGRVQLLLLDWSTHLWYVFDNAEC